MLARRVVAGALVVLAGVATIRSDPQSDRVDVVVASRDIAPGTPLTAEDVSLESRSARTVPDGVATDVSSVLHTTLAGRRVAANYSPTSVYWAAASPKRPPGETPVSSVYTRLTPR